MDAYPGIVFRDGPAGRRPAVLGGPDVWEVVQVFLAEGRDVGATAENLGLQHGLIEAAVAYYVDNRDVIDEWIEANRAMMPSPYSSTAPPEISEERWRTIRSLAASVEVEHPPKQVEPPRCRLPATDQ
jgi:hypothetical protein